MPDVNVRASDESSGDDGPFESRESQDSKFDLCFEHSTKMIF